MMKSEQLWTLHACYYFFYARRLYSSLLITTRPPSLTTIEILTEVRRGLDRDHDLFCFADAEAFLISLPLNRRDGSPSKLR